MGWSILVIGFSVGDFVNSTDSAVGQLSTTSVPGLEYDNGICSVVWGDGETSHIQVTFAIPDDYSSGGAFRVLADESANNTPCQIDFAVFVNTPDAAAGWDSSVTDQTPVALTDSEANSPEQVTLPVTTDFASLAAGDHVTLLIWRDDVADGTADLEIYYVEFYYTKEL